MELHFLATYFFVVLAIIYSKKESLGVERDILVSSLRALVQLLALGYVLLFVFETQEFRWIVLICAVMLLFAAYSANEKESKKRYTISFVAISTPSLFIAAYLILFDIVSIKANELVPIFGMLVGNSLQSYLLSMDRLKSDAAKTRDEIEAKIALGSKLKDAMINSIRGSVKSALIPIINNLKTVGIIFIPGITTGMLISGAEPLKAISYQLVIMYMLLATSLFSSVLCVMLNYKRVLESSGS